jgi:hypothetical protein
VSVSSSRVSRAQRSFTPSMAEHSARLGLGLSVRPGPRWFARANGTGSLPRHAWSLWPFRHRDRRWFSTRWYARALSPRRVIAMRSSASPPASTFGRHFDGVDEFRVVRPGCSRRWCILLGHPPIRELPDDPESALQHKPQIRHVIEEQPPICDVPVRNFLVRLAATARLTSSGMPTRKGLTRQSKHRKAVRDAAGQGATQLAYLMA